MNLTALQNSPFLQSLGWAIANSLWQAAALWIAYLLVIGIYKSASARFKNNLSTILLSSAFVWFCITLFTKYFTIEKLAGYEIQYYEVDTLNASFFNWNEILKNVAGILPYLSVAYLLLLIFLSFRLIKVYRFTSFIKSNGLQKPGVEWKLFTEKVARHMGINKKIRLWVSHHIDVPATIGFLKPVILIPLASVNQLSTEQLEAIILHELSHIKRNDYLINLFVSIIETILFFNPFIVLLARVIKRERENCCDDLVIQYQYDRHAYASALLSLEQFRNINLRLAIGATSGKKQLLLRIKRIMEVNSNSNFNYGQKLVALFLITGIICSVAWLSPQSNESKKQQANTTFSKTYDLKIPDDKKSEIIVVKQTDNSNNKTNTIVLKPQLKKTTVPFIKPLKELRDLNLKEIAQREYALLDRLLKESKKEINRKNLKFVPRKFLTARGASSTPTLFNTGTMFPANTSFSKMELNQMYAVDIQKLQKEWDKVHFSYSYDSEEMQTAIQLALQSKQLAPLLRLNQNLKVSEIEKLIKAEALNSGEKKLQRVIVNRLPKPTVTVSGRSIHHRDSLSAAETKMVNDRTKQVEGVLTKVTSTGEYKRTTPPQPTAYAYVYTNGTGNTENGTKRTTHKHVVGHERQSPCSPGVSGSNYRVVPNATNNKNSPKPSGSVKDNIRVQYKDGIVYINGEEVAIPEANEILAQFSLKGKKISSSSKTIESGSHD